MNARSIKADSGQQVPVATSGKVLKPSFLAWLLLVLVATLLMALAYWQWCRGAEKQALLTRYGAHSQAAVLNWPSAQALGLAAADRPIQLRGHFLPNYRVALDNQMRGATAGYHLFQVFQPEHSKQSVLVNMGWLPTDRDGGPAVPTNSVPPAEVIDGSVNFPSHWLTVGAPEFTRGLWRAGRIEPALWSQRWHLDLMPWTLRLSPAMNIGYVREWAPSANQVMGPERHRAYAFQWAALALAWCACWWAFWRRRRLDSKA